MPPLYLWEQHTHTHYTKEQGGACTPEKIIKVKRALGTLKHKNPNSKTFPLLMLG